MRQSPIHLIVVFSEKFNLRTATRSKLEVQRLVVATTLNQSGRWLAHFLGCSKAVAPVFEKHFFSCDINQWTVNWLAATQSGLHLR